MFRTKYTGKTYKLQSKFLAVLGDVQYSRFPLFISYKKTYGDNTIGDYYHQIKSVIKPGDIILRRKDGQAINILIPGHYTHAGLYIGDNESYGKERIIHSRTPEVVVTDLISYMRNADEIAILRPRVEENDAKEAIQFAINNLGKKFDYNFLFEDPKIKRRRYSCTELVFMSYKNNHKDLHWHLEDVEKFKVKTKAFRPDSFLPGKNSKTELVFEERITRQ